MKKDMGSLNDMLARLDKKETAKMAPEARIMKEGASPLPFLSLHFVIIIGQIAFSGFHFMRRP